eukprot:16958-Heterococcus_DN1.PRE.2
MQRLTMTSHIAKQVAALMRCAHMSQVAPPAAVKTAVSVTPFMALLRQYMHQHCTAASSGT